jgi:hypothetical protein
MGYWFILVFFLVICALVACAKNCKDEKENNRFPCVALAVIFSVMVIPFVLDIPFAIAGNQSIKTHTFPKECNTSPMGIQMIYIEDQLFFSYENYDLDEYEQGKGYQVFYTPFSRSILKIIEIEE